MSVFEILQLLESDNSRLFKIDTLRNHRDNKVLKRACHLALNPLINFYIRKIPDYTPAKSNQADTLDSVLSSLEMLSTRQVTGNAAIEYLTKLLSSLAESDAKVLERIIQKDLKCGVSDATVNKVWPGLIPEFPCMLASAYDQKLINKAKFPAYVQLKLDGMRFNAIVRNGGVEFRSRNGKEIQIADPTFAQQFIQIANGQDLVFDGELLVRGKDGNLLDRKTGNGIINKAVKGTQTQAEGKMVCATLWDMIPFADFEVGVSKLPYENRFEKLDMLIEGANDRVSLVWNREVENIDEARVIFEQFLAEGQEGIILKTKNMIWENKRSKHQIKFKGEYECDLKIVGWVEGTGKHEGRMGALMLESSDGVIKVNVGTGFSDDDRNKITKDVIGKIAAIKYNARITDTRTGVESLFLPVFLEVREDKTEADSSNKVK